MNIAAITNYLDSLLEKGIPSFDCMIYENHELVYRHMSGTIDAAQQTAVNDSTQYLMYSMTKVQTMTAFLQLVEQNKISLEDDVADYLPEYKNLTVEKNGIVKPAQNKLKIKHLLSMQSGLDYNLERPGICRVLNEKGAHATTRDLVNAFIESPLHFEPGEHFFYSLSHDVIAAIIEVVSGIQYSDYLKKNIWQPLQMDRTFFAKPINDDVSNLAAQYICNESGEICLTDSSCAYQLSDTYESGGAGLISCTKDYAIFADMIACGGISKDNVRILKQETIDLMKTNLLSDISRQDLADSMGRKGYGYGCGVQILLEPQSINSTSPAGVFGWDGAAGSCITMDTNSKRSVVYIQHVRNCGMAYDTIHPTLRDFVFTQEK